MCFTEDVSLHDKYPKSFSLKLSTNKCTHIKLHIKTLKITPTCFNLLDHPQGVTFFLAKVILKLSQFNLFL